MGDTFPLVLGSVTGATYLWLPQALFFVCSIDLFVHLPILSSGPALAVHVVSAYSFGEIGEASKVT